MNLIIATPLLGRSVSGNRITAYRWAALLRSLGHTAEVVPVDEFPRRPDRFDGLIALHAVKSHGAIDRWARECPGRPLAVCLTGTDLHTDLRRPDSEPGQQALKSLDRANRIILLEPRGRRHLADRHQHKSLVIFQSARPLSAPPQPVADRFVVTVVGHLRDVKDPFRTEIASRQLPAASRICVVHIGMAMQPGLAEEAVGRQGENSRYHWQGELNHAATRRWLAGSQLTVISSRQEGAPSVISEAVVDGIPVLATRIDGCVGLLGEDYPGLFEVGESRELAGLLSRCENDPAFYRGLQAALGQRAGWFAPARERESLRQLLVDLVSPPTGPAGRSGPPDG